MQEIIEPISRERIKAELTPERFLRYTNKASNELYIVDAKNSPQIMQEIGRLREVSFREAGGGTGQALDVDQYDTDDVAFKQLIVWDPEDEEIVAGYRYICCWDFDLNNGGANKLATAHLLDFSDNFTKNYLPHTIELGRSFVQPNYQADRNKKGIFSLDNLWDGLGVLFEEYPQSKYLFGKVTMYPSYNTEARDCILSFMHHFFPQRGELMKPFNPLQQEVDVEHFMRQIRGLPYKEAYKILGQHVRDLGERIPPLISSYMNLSETMMTFGTALNDEFGDVEETGILVNFEDIFPEKKQRHMEGYERNPFLII